MNDRDGDSRTSEVNANSFKKTGYGSLACTVSRGLWQSAICSQAGISYQVTATATDHIRQHGRHAIDYANHIHIDQFRNLFVAKIRNERIHADAGIRHQHVARAEAL